MSSLLLMLTGVMRPGGSDGSVGSPAAGCGGGGGGGSGSEGDTCDVIGGCLFSQRSFAGPCIDVCGLKLDMELTDQNTLRHCQL